MLRSLRSSSSHSKYFLVIWISGMWDFVFPRSYSIFHADEVRGAEGPPLRGGNAPTPLRTSLN
jgi:hypothetical protein